MLHFTIEAGGLATTTVVCGAPTLEQLTDSAPNIARLEYVTDPDPCGAAGAAAIMPAFDPIDPSMDRTVVPTVLPEVDAVIVPG